MKKTMAVLATAAMAAACNAAETYSLTNGATVSGTIVSGIVAQVVMRMTDGTETSIPVAEFSKPDRRMLPENAAGIYVWYMDYRKISEQAMDESEIFLFELRRAVEKQNKMNLSISMDNLQRAVEISAWKEANEMWGSEADAMNRKLHVTRRLRDYLDESADKDTSGQNAGKDLP